MYPQVAEIEGQYSAANRANELQQLQSALPQYQQAINKLTPGYAEAVGSTGALAQKSMEASLKTPQLSSYEQGIKGPEFGQFAGQVGKPQSGQYVDAIRGPQAGQFVSSVGGPQAGQFLNEVGGPQAGQFVGNVQGPQMNSGLNRINTGLVNQYLGQMPGVQQYSQFLAQNSAAELAAGKSLTPEEQRMADQSVRSAYAARGTAMGNQAISSEVLNRADVASQRYQQRLANAANASQQIQGIYTPALNQAYQRQAANAEYNLGAQGQAYQQAMGKEQLSGTTQGAAYAQAMGREQLAGTTQGAAYSQAMGKEQLAATTQAEAYQQAMAREQLAGSTQELAYKQAMGLEQGTAANQQASFQQALQRNQAQQQGMQFGQQLQAGYAQMGAGAMGQLQQAQAPILQAFYKQPILQGQVGQSQQMGMAMQQQAGPQYFNPESQTGMGSIFGAYNSQNNLAGANAQANAASSSGMMSAGGAVAGAAIVAAGMCWIARACYGVDSNKWIQFRNSMLRNGSDKFISWYCKNGKAIGEKISPSPVARFFGRIILSVINGTWIHQK